MSPDPDPIQHVSVLELREGAILPVYSDGVDAFPLRHFLKIQPGRQWVLAELFVSKFGLRFDPLGEIVE